MKVEAISILCRSQRALFAAWRALQLATAANAVTEPTLLTGPRSDGYPELLTLPLGEGQPLLQFIHTPKHKWMWRDVEGTPPEQLRLVCAHLSEPRMSAPRVHWQSLAGLVAVLQRGELQKFEIPPLANQRCGFADCGDAGSCGSQAASEVDVTTAHERGSGVLASMLTSLRGSIHGHSLDCAHVASASRCPRPTHSPDSIRSTVIDPTAVPNHMAAPAALKEVVIGSLHMGAFAASQSTLEAAGAQRHSSAQSVWLLGCRSPRATHVRLLPSRYSALVFRAPADLVQTRAQLLAHADVADSPLAGAEVALYGQRRGDDNSGQLALRSPMLQGLDVRFCAAPAHMPYFNEAPEAVYDGVEPALNPPVGHSSKKVPLACRSLASIEMAGVLRRRLGLSN